MHNKAACFTSSLTSTFPSLSCCRPPSLPAADVEKARERLAVQVVTFTARCQEMESAQRRAEQEKDDALEQVLKLQKRVHIAEGGSKQDQEERRKAMASVEEMSEELVKTQKKLDRLTMASEDFARCH